MCCVCNGTCCHVGPCSLCVMHGGRVTTPPVQASNTFWINPLPVPVEDFRPLAEKLMSALAFLLSTYEATLPDETDRSDEDTLMVGYTGALINRASRELWPKS